MLKILIVDDDMLTRKGIQMLMPWEKHQMSVVGEASNGKEALSFLEQHPDVDLALVDLDMPVMNGTVFIREASQIYPKLSFVVLTVHTEFEYVQQILRLGAIDYIAKTQFDQENFDQILERIQAGIAKKNSISSPVSFSDWKSSKILDSEIYALISIGQDDDSEIFDFFSLNQMSSSCECYELQPNMWIFQKGRKEFIFPETFSHTMLLAISDVYEMSYSELGQQLRRYLKNQFFYDYRPIKEVNRKHAYELSEDILITDMESFETMKNEWSSLNWIHENQLFDQFCIDLKKCRLKPAQLYHFLLNLEMIWNTSYSKTTGEQIVLPPSFNSWYEVEDWLAAIYDTARLFRSDSKYSGEVVKNILSVQNFIQQNYASSLDATVLARRIGMSNGYFSRCFHDLVGESFSDYCTRIRLTKAKDMLKTTGETIQIIAFSVGYRDEKYFSRIFKKMVGMSPSEFRKEV